MHCSQRWKITCGLDLHLSEILRAEWVRSVAAGYAVKACWSNQVLLLIMKNMPC